MLCYAPTRVETTPIECNFTPTGADPPQLPEPMEFAWHCVPGWVLTSKLAGVIVETVQGYPPQIQVRHPHAAGASRKAAGNASVRWLGIIPGHSPCTPWHFTALEIAVSR